MSKDGNVDAFQSHIHVRVLTQTQIEKEVGSNGLQIIGMEGDIYIYIYIYIGGVVSNVY